MYNQFPFFFFLYRDIFYVRNHLPVPRIDEDDYELQVTGIGIKETKFTLNDLKTKFPKTTVTATIMCAGNRRNEMKKVSDTCTGPERIFIIKSRKKPFCSMYTLKI